MTREEAIERLKIDIYKYADFTENPNEDEFWMAFDMAIKALEQKDWKFYYDHGYAQAKRDLQEPKTDTWSIKDVADTLSRHGLIREQEPKTGHCKDCKYFEYDSVAKVDGIPLIVAHEICNKWGNGCKTKEDGYCFMFEPQESEEV
jgi:hypothetical protein